MRTQRHFRIISIIAAILLGILTSVFSYFQPLRMADEYVTNSIYQNNPFRKADSRITLIAYDEESSEIYGDLTTISRELLANAVTEISSHQPAVIGLDLDLSKESNDTSADTYLSNACKSAGNVVACARINDMEPLPDSTNWTEHHFSGLALPYESLLEHVTVGVADSFQTSADGSIRNAALTVQMRDSSYDAFAVSIYKSYKEFTGELYELPELNNRGLFGFNNIWDINGYNIISFKDLLSGNYDSSYLSNSIVLVGSYQTQQIQNGIDHFKAMKSPQELLSQAAVVQALLNQQTIKDINLTVQSLLYGFIITIIYLCISGRKRWLSILINSIILIGIVSLCFTLNLFGFRMFLLTPILASLVSMACFILQQLLFSKIEHAKMKQTLQLYVDSNVVNEIEHATVFELAKLSQRKHIAVLFVDIRGFTTISEKLEPEQVVDILNDYLTQVGYAISSWGGTLDKFIGDAAMALFNAPDDQEDYIFHAICAADDIRIAAESIAQKYKKLYQIDVAVGIGINCGDAIVGNIGSLSRMDYTAIGDTVNTASRLESKAAPGQILVSESVITGLDDRLSTSYIGELTLKGKEHTVKTYQIDSIKKPKPPKNKKTKGDLLHETHLLYSKIKPTR